jgi:hypothetical protein
VIVDHDEGNYWLVFDSYDNSHKKLAWDFSFEMAKRYHITQIPVSERSASWMAGFIAFCQRLLARVDISQNDRSRVIDEVLTYQPPPNPTPMPPIAPATPLPPSEPHNPTPSEPQKASHPSVKDLCLLIPKYEGYAPGTRAYRNKNPGNCRYNKDGYSAIYGHVGEDRKGVIDPTQSGFAIFSTHELGWLYLERLLTIIAKGQDASWNYKALKEFKIQQCGDLTILQFFTIYAPTADSNDPEAYAKWIGQRLGVDYKTFKLKELLEL